MANNDHYTILVLQKNDNNHSNLTKPGLNEWF